MTRRRWWWDQPTMVVARWAGMTWVLLATGHVTAAWWLIPLAGYWHMYKDLAHWVKGLPERNVVAFLIMMYARFIGKIIRGESLHDG